MGASPRGSFSPHGCLLAVDALTEEQLGQACTTREALNRLAAGEEPPASKPGSWNAPTEEQTPPPKIL